MLGQLHHGDRTLNVIRVQLVRVGSEGPVQEVVRFNKFNRFGFNGFGSEPNEPDEPNEPNEPTEPNEPDEPSEPNERAIAAGRRWRERRRASDREPSHVRCRGANFDE